jgi:hypothetical protein
VCWLIGKLELLSGITLMRNVQGVPNPLPDAILPNPMPTEIAVENER